MKKITTCSVTSSDNSAAFSTSSSHRVPHVSHSSSSCTTVPVGIKPTSAGPCGTTELVSRSVLDVTVEDSGLTRIPLPTLKNMWNKAERLIQASGAILKVPWSSDPKARLVMSSSSEHPHLVKALGLKYSCDDKCVMFKGFSLCSHVLAAAQQNGDLGVFYCLSAE